MTKVEYFVPIKNIWNMVPMIKEIQALIIINEWKVKSSFGKTIGGVKLGDSLLH